MQDVSRFFDRSSKNLRDLSNNSNKLYEALYAKSKTTGRTQTKEDKTIIVVDSILKGI